jgi:TRAP-type mannitol/chloroaromatic compound transport system permease small subunit
MLEAQVVLLLRGLPALLGYTLLRNEHVRIDVINGRFSARTQTWIDVFGTIFFLLPMAAIFIYLSWPVFIRTYTHGEISTNAAGSSSGRRGRWSHRLHAPRLQGLSELIKRIAFLTGRDPTRHAP